MRSWLLPALVSLLLTSTGSAATFGGPSTIANDDSCDIGVLPAATLLLPYFEVDLENRLGETTTFTVTNVGHLEQVAHVTLWTDLGYPVVDFNIFLTGYDVQTVNLYDVLARGEIAGPLGTSFKGSGSPEGDFSSERANPRVFEETCRNIPRDLGTDMLARVRRAFTRGDADGCRVGGTHRNAIGYATIDVVRRCDAVTAAEERYFSNVILFDNVLTGDYQQVNGAQHSAQSNPLVHIRAIPEGSNGETELPRTFYSHLQSGTFRTRDARQPLPSTFVAHWIGGAEGAFDTSLKIWREGNGTAACHTAIGPSAVAEIVRFDPDENVSVDAGTLRLPSASLVAVNGREDDGLHLAAPRNAVAGWLYLNLDDGAGDGTPRQAWVVSSMRAAGKYSVDTDATALGNGCSPAAPLSSAHGTGRPPIQPAPNVTGATTSVPTSVRNDDSCDIGLLPAATLLLPYFAVDLDAKAIERDSTLFTIVNTSPLEQIAQVTLWTSYGFPLLTFSVHLSGYDMHSISMYDLLTTGTLGPARQTPRGTLARRNPALDLSACDRIPRQLTAAQLTRVRQALTLGRAPAAGNHPACATAGGMHGDKAVGYATIDVVGSCTTLDPSLPAYYTDAIRFDNVLTGDYQQVRSGHNLAQGGPLVHIRAIPEGGDARTRAADPATYGVNLPRTFYGIYQPAATRGLDARQPLPSTFAVRYVDMGLGSFQTSLKIWMQGRPVTTCASASANSLGTFADAVTFDDRENARGVAPLDCPILCPIYPRGFPVTGRHDLDGHHIPRLEHAISGWVFLNLNPTGATEDARQAWVISSMSAEGRYSVDIDATALGNGCSPAIGASVVTDGRAGTVIGPATNANPRKP